MKYINSLKILFIIGVLSWVPIQNIQAQKVKDALETNDKDALHAFEDGVKFAILGETEKALSSFRKAESLSPTNAAIKYKLGELSLKAGRSSEGIAYAQEALKLDKKNPYYYTLLASAYEKQRDFKKAAEIYTELIENIPDSDNYLFELVNAQIQATDFKNALKTLDKLQKRFGINEELIRQKQQIYLQMNRLDLAIKETRTLVETNPNEIRYSLMLYELLKANGKDKEADELLATMPTTGSLSGYVALMKLKQALKDKGEPKNYTALFNSVTIDPEVNIDEKVQLLAPFLRKDLPASYPSWDEIISWAKNIKEAHPLEAKAHAFYGDFLNINDRTKEARNAYLNSLALENGTIQVWEQVILIDSKLEETDSLYKHAKEASSLFPNNGIIQFYYGRAAFFKKEYQEAIDALELAKRYVPDNKALEFECTALLAESYHQLKKHKQSDELFERALKMDENNVMIMNNYAYYLSERKEKLEVARKLGDRLIKLEPNNPTYLDTYGWILFVSKQYKEALPYLEKAAKESESAVIIEHYGDVLFKVGEKDKAIEQWKRARKLNPENPTLLDKKINSKQLSNEL